LLPSYPISTEYDRCTELVTDETIEENKIKATKIKGNIEEKKKMI